MKQVNISISFDDEKLNALKRYMGKKDLEPEAELGDAVQKLYEKYVPLAVREYIDESDVAVPHKEKPKRTARTHTTTPDNMQEVSDGKTHIG